MKQFLASYFIDEDGASAAEYAVLVAVVVAVVYIGVQSYDLAGIFGSVNSKVTSCINAAVPGTTC